MNLLNSINRVDQLHQLIQLQKTGTPKQLAVRLGISRANLYMWIEELISLNFPISYSRSKETFYYEKEVKFTIAFKVEVIENSQDLEKINGGSLVLKLPSNFLDGTNISLSPYFASTKSQATGFELW